MGPHVGLLPVGPMSGSASSPQASPLRRKLLSRPRGGRPFQRRKKKVQRFGFVSFPWWPGKIPCASLHGQPWPSVRGGLFLEEGVQHR